MADPVESGSYTPETIQRRLKMAEAMLTGEPKVQHWAQGLNELLKGYVGGTAFKKAEDDERAGQSAQYSAIANILMPGLGGGAGAVPGGAPGGAPPGPSAATMGAGPDTSVPIPPADTTPIVPNKVPTSPMPPVQQATQGVIVPQADPYAQDTFRTPLDAMRPDRSAMVAALGGGGAPPPQMPAGGPTPSPMPPGPTGATPLPAGPAGAAATPGMEMGATDQAASRAKIAAMLRDPNSYVRKMGMQLGQQIAAKMVTGPEWTPVAGPNGALMQRSSTGELKVHPLAGDYDVKNLADGSVVAVDKKDPTKFHVIQNAGVTQGLVNYEGQKKRAETEGEIQGKSGLPALQGAIKQAETEGDVRGKAVATLPATLEKVEFALDTLGKLEAHPGLPSGTGLTGIPRRSVAGTKEYGFNALFEQAKGQAYLDAFESMKGAGAITDTEGKVATAAKARMDAAQSEGDFRAALKDYRQVLTSGLNRLQLMSGMPKADFEALRKKVGPGAAGGGAASAGAPPPPTGFVIQ